MGKNKQDPPKNKSDRLLQALRPLAEALRKIPDALAATWNSIRTDPQVGPIARALVERDPEAWPEVVRQVRPYYWPRILAAAQRDPTIDLAALSTTACWLVLRRTVGHLTPGETKTGWPVVQLRLRRAIELQLARDVGANRKAERLSREISLVEADRRGLADRSLEGVVEARDLVERLLSIATRAERAALEAVLDGRPLTQGERAALARLRKKAHTA